MRKKEIVSPTVLQKLLKEKNIEKIKVAVYYMAKTKDKGLEEYGSEIKNYEQKISKNKKWVKAGIYADKDVFKTKLSDRVEFQRMIADAQTGKIDLIICKSIVMFGKNVIEILTYVRLLKSLNIAVIFEEENINTMDEHGEVILSVLVYLVQQDNINNSHSYRKAKVIKIPKENSKYNQFTEKTNLWVYKYINNVK